MIAGIFQKPALPAPPVDHVKTFRIQIPQPVLIQHIEIAGIDAAVRLHHILQAADPSLFAGLRHLSHQNTDIILELSDIGLSALL